MYVGQRAERERSSSSGRSVFQRKVCPVTVRFMNLHFADSLIVPVAPVKMGRSSSTMRVLIGDCHLHREPFNTRQSLQVYKHIPLWNTSLPPATPMAKYAFATPGWRSARYLVGPTKGLCKM